MTARAWLTLVAMAVCFGGIVGWSLRISTVSDRYVRSLAERHEATARYWDTQTNIIITNNTLERNKRNGKNKD